MDEGKKELQPSDEEPQDLEVLEEESEVISGGTKSFKATPVTKKPIIANFPR